VSGRFVAVLAAVAAGLAAAGGCDGADQRPEAAQSKTACPPSQTGTGSVLVPGPNNGLPASAAAGEPLVIEAVIVDRACRPVAGVGVYLWHTDARGLYGPAGTEKCCYYQGRVQTDHNGRFRLETIRPAQYPEPNAPPAHIHLRIQHQAGELTTMIVFTGQRPPSAGTPTGEQLPVELRRQGGGWRADAVFVLSR